MPIDRLSRYFVQEHPRETAIILDKHPVDDIVEFFESIADKDAAQILRYLSPEQSLNCLCVIRPEHAAGILKFLETEISARMLGRLKTDIRSSIIDNMTSTVSHRLKQVLKYPAGTIGQYISPDVFIANQNMTAQAVMESARIGESELLSEVFVIDESYVLCGSVSLRDLMLADAEIKMNQIMVRPDSIINVRTDLAYVKDDPRWQNREFLPVTNQKNVFVGVLKRSSLFEALSSEYYQERRQVPLMETVVEVADLFWDICSNLIFPKGEIETRGRKDE